MVVSSSPSRVLPKVENPLRMILFGPPGIGKTVFFGTGVEDPRVSPMLILDYDGGMRSIQSKVVTISTLAELKKVESLNLPQDKAVSFRPKSWNDTEQVLNFLVNQKYFRSVVVDSFSELNYQNLAAIVESEKLKGSNRDGDVPQIGDYGKSANQLRKLVRIFRDLEIHSFYTAHVNDVKDELDGTIETRPSFIGKLSVEIPALVDVVGYVQMSRVRGESIRQIRFQPTPRIQAKDRTEGGRLGAILDNPTLPKVLDLIEKERTL
jgi:hypothetical protein